MKTRSKALVLSLCAILLVASTVFGTLAYLTDTKTVTNTFTVGKVGITLDEAKVNPDGTVVEGADRVQENKYHLIPGHTYTKDPTIHVTEGSEDCWLFVKVENGIADIEAATTVADQMAAKGWNAVAGATNIYAYKEKVSAGDDVVVFESFKISGDVTGEKLAEYNEKTIVIISYAVQADGFDTAAAAWESTFGA